LSGSFEEKTVTFLINNKYRYWLFTLLLSLPVIAQETIFLDGFENHSPVIDSSPPTMAAVGESYEYDVEASDIDGDTLLYTLTTSPGGMDINTSTGLISWIPASSGDFPAEVDVSDGKGGSARQDWVISVTEGLDSDSDGLSDAREEALGTDPGDPDSDDDGLKDGEEVNTLMSDPLDPDSDDDDLIDGDEVNTHGTDLNNNDTDGDFFGDGLELEYGTDPLDENDFPAGPPDPDTLAPPHDPTISTILLPAVVFIYDGVPPIQTGVPEDTIDALRVAVLRGAVTTRDGAPLPGVTVTIRDHAEFGQTESRVNGRFDMVVNGGGLLTVSFQKSGYLPVKRRVDVPWQDYFEVPDVVMVPLDSQVTTIDLDQGVTLMAESSVSDDVDGQRHSAVIFPAGTSAELQLPGGGTQAISSLNIRATEYTVGENGPAAMPGILPTTSAYTYAVELSADEALAGGATGVTFNQPVFNYVENFLDFPVGVAVPTGYYDHEKSHWVASKNGLVIKIVSISGGLADIDVDGDDIADTGTALSDLGFTDAEREKLGAAYSAGQSLWRVPMTHFSPADHNYPWGPPFDAFPPRIFGPAKVEPETECGVTTANSSIIECQNQTVGERIPITGTPFTLNYRSSQVPGRKTGRTLKIQLSGGSVPASLKRIDLSLSIAGQKHGQSFPPSPNQSTTFVWDGKDAYHREVSGKHTVTGAIGYVYEAEYYSPAESEIAFNKFGTQAFVNARQDIVLYQYFQATLGTYDANSQGLGGWMLDVHKVYDPVGRVLVSGGGTSRGGAHNQQGIISRVAGRVESASGFSGDGGPATSAMMDRPLDVFVMPDGGFLFTDHDNHRIRQVSADGIITTIAGNGSSTHSGDGGPATAAGTPDPLSVTMGPDGSIYFTESRNRIRRITTDGLISTIAGTGAPGFSGDGGQATLAQISPSKGLAFAPDGTLYFGDSVSFSEFAGGRIRKVDTNGIIDTIAGSSSYDYSGDGGPAIAATMRGPDDLAIGPDGHIFIALLTRVRAITPDGLILTIAGNGTEGSSGDGGPAWEAQLDHAAGLAVIKDALYIADEDSDLVRKVDSEGIITTVVGSVEGDVAFGDGGPVLAAGFDLISGLDIDPQGGLYISDDGENQVRHVATLMPGFSSGDLGIASRDGSEYYQFNAAGKHLRTWHGLTGAVLYEFAYDADGLLETITDGDAKVTTIMRDSDGNPTGIESPFGQVTSTSVDFNGYINRITNPASESFHINSSPGGLIEQTTDPRGRISSYAYDNVGRLTSQSDNANFSQDFERVESVDGFTVTRTTGMARSFEYEIQLPRSGKQQNTNTAPDGSQATSDYGLSAGTLNSTSVTGMTYQVEQGPDPRFGMQAPFSNSTEVTAPGGPTLTVSSSSNAVLTNQSDPFSLEILDGTVTVDGRTTMSNYTAATRTLVTTSPEGRTTQLEIDEQGRIVSSQYADLAPLAVSFNSLGQLETLSSGSGSEQRMTSFTYGVDGFRAGLTDGLGRTTSMTRDAAGRITSKTLPGDISVLFSYSPGGELEGITPPGQPEHGFTYTLHGQRESVVPPVVSGSGPSTFAYNADRQLSTINRSGGEEITFEYDADGRVQGIELSEEGISAAVYSFSYITGDLLDTVTGPGSQTVSYDYQGDLVTGVTWGGMVEGSFTRTFDSAFRASSETVNAESAITFTYDNDDLVTGAGALSITRSATNGLADGTSLGVVSDAWTYNNFGEIEGYSASANATPVYEVDYTRDKLGRITQKVETVSGVADTYDYDYDPRGQLLEVQKNSAVIESYSYDDNGNRTSATVNSITTNATLDDQDRMTAYGDNTFTYSPAGRLATKTEPGDLVTEYDYDVVGNLLGVTLTDATEVTYGLDGPDRRVQRSVDTVITHRFLYDGILPVAELDESGTVVSQFVYVGGNVPEYLIRDGVNYRIVADQVGSVRLVINASTGMIAQRIDYDSFGNVLVDTNPGFQPFGFAGGLYDPATALVRFGMRDYYPEVGRWTVKDPTGFGGNDSNLYRYVNNDPVNLIDSTGTDFWDAANGGLNAWFDLSIGGFVDYLRVHPITGGPMSIYDTLDGFFDFDEPHIGDILPPPRNIDDFQMGYIGTVCLAAVASIPMTAGTGVLSKQAKAAQSMARNADRAADLRNGRQVFSTDQSIKLAEDARKAADAVKKAGANPIQRVPTYGSTPGKGTGGGVGSAG